ncbi:MAG: iron ABC transporter permease [Propionibacteriaceae bacterium]|nr:iron ABC transporter permease [Propionibacteriaceae bacterium]
MIRRTGVHRAGRIAWVVAGAIPVLFLAVFFLAPVSNLVLRGFHDDGVWSLAGFTEVFSAPRTWRILWFTLSTATLATLLCVLLGLPVAYLLYRCRFPGRGVLRAIVAVPFVLPTVVVAVAFGSLFNPGALLGFLQLKESYPAILLALCFFNVAVVVRTTGSVWARLDPRLGQAAQVLGASPVRTLLTVTLPALGPAIAAGASLVFLFCSTAFGIIMVLGGVKYSTIETEIWYQTTQLLDLRAAAALSITQLVIVSSTLLVSNALERRTQQSLRLHVDDSGEHPLSPTRDWFALTITGLVVVLLLVLPIANLVLRSLRRDGRWSLQNYANLATTGSRGTLTVPVWQAVWNSAWTASAACAIAVTLGVLVSLVASRRPRTSAGRRGLTALEGAFLLPLGVSAVTVGFGYLITLNRPPLDLRSSLVLIPIAQALVALPLVVRSLLPALRAIDPRQLEAARALGSNSWQVLRRIELPHLIRGLGLAIGFALATSLGEFGATSFLSRPENPTLPVVIYRLFGRPGADNYGMALAASALLACLTAIVMAAAEYARPKGVATW